MANMVKLTGEYWIIDGEPTFADGDVGDINHEGYALDVLRREVLEALEMEPDDDLYDWDSLVAEMPAVICKMLDTTDGQERSESETPEDLALALLLEHSDLLGLKDEDVKQAFERGAMDVRDYMGRTRGWISMHGHEFGCWFLFRHTLAEIVSGVETMLEEMGEEDLEADVRIQIHVASTGKDYSTKLSILKTEDFSSFALQPDLPEPGPNAQVVKMDKDITHEFYKSPHD